VLTPRVLRGGELHYIKMMVSGLWVLVAVVILIVTDLSWSALIVLAAVGLLFRSRPSSCGVIRHETISESSHEVRR
jgi:hypothetical protein